MTSVLPLLLLAWVAVGYALFRRLPGAYATLVVVVAGVLLLPEVQALPVTDEAPKPIVLPLIKLTKINVISYALLAGSLCWDWRRWQTTRPRWYDLPMAALCISPLLSSFANNLGLYDGCAEALQQTLVWGVPYWLGRLYLGDRDGLRAWAAAIAVGGVLYAFPCLMEIRLSPQLHFWLYGFHAHNVNQSHRLATFRPMVFMEHGLAMGLFMTIASVSAYWLWRNGTFARFVWHPRHRPLQLGWVVAWLTAVTVLCRSTGALVLGSAVALALELSRSLRTPLFLLALIAVPPIFVAARYTGVLTGPELVARASDLFSADRAESLAFRLQNESQLLDRAKERPLLGWGGYGRARVKDEDNHDVSVSDSLWIITVGNLGLFGLGALFLAFVLPVLRFVWLYPPQHWQSVIDAPAAVAAAALLIYTGDHLFNAMLNPIYLLAAGGLAGAAASLTESDAVTCEEADETVPLTPALPLVHHTGGGGTFWG